jgi:hypothetical protein
MWVDEDDQLRKMRYSVDLAKVPSATGPTGEHLSGVVTTIAELYDLGMPVKIELPAPADVSDVPLKGPASV